jgi:hypothetical protein
MDRKCGVVLDSDMDVAEMALQWVPRVDRIGPGSMENDVDRTNRLVNRMRYGEPRVSNLA